MSLCTGLYVQLTAPSPAALAGALQGRTECPLGSESVSHPLFQLPLPLFESPVQFSFPSACYLVLLIFFPFLFALISSFVLELKTKPSEAGTAARLSVVNHTRSVFRWQLHKHHPFTQPALGTVLHALLSSPSATEHLAIKPMQTQ